MKWHRECESYRLAQSIGKQYSYNAELSELDELKKKVLYYEVKGESHLVVPNLLEQNFKASAPNQKWLTNITYLPFRESILYLSSIPDLYNNEAIAYKVSGTQNAQLFWIP